MFPNSYGGVLFFNQQIIENEKQNIKIEVDARVEEKIADESFSIGEYVLTGGELPALIMTDAIARNITGVLGSKE